MSDRKKAVLFVIWSVVVFVVGVLIGAPAPIAGLLIAAPPIIAGLCALPAPGSRSVRTRLLEDYLRALNEGRIDKDEMRRMEELLNKHC